MLLPSLHTTHVAPAACVTDSQHTSLSSFPLPGRTLVLTDKHFIPVCLQHCTAEDLARGTAVMQYEYAGRVQVGDQVLVVERAHDAAANATSSILSGAAVRFAAVESKWSADVAGLYAPFVMGGDLVVDQVVACPYPRWTLAGLAEGLGAERHLPQLYEVLLRPMYALYLLLGPSLSQWIAHEGLGLVDVWERKADGLGYIIMSAVLALVVMLPVRGLLALGRRSSSRAKGSQPHMA
mmetsp:Transcript_38956/g.86653  ORF Transcript_38956/g.86653 Transcript_38956/m.86653 type:complete len:237 (+) Transcript_38956:763-1473(+)